MTRKLQQDTTTTEPPTPIVMRLTASGAFRRHCDVCGGDTWKSSVVCQGSLSGQTGWLDTCDAFVICETCLENDVDIDAELERHAERLTEQARWLRSLRGRVVRPTFAEYLERFAALGAYECRVAYGQTSDTDPTSDQYRADPVAWLASLPPDDEGYKRLAAGICDPLFGPEANAYKRLAAERDDGGAR